MKQAVLVGVREFSIQQVETPELRSGEILNPDGGAKVRIGIT